ncbi:MAG TPA: helix-turn-helix transcriptional regulator [Candidatus Hydrogenedentes bacterium]|nr:helix-turn-helix transcriptional regulator [Candidatus Hydrogenedentota bacterium]
MRPLAFLHLPEVSRLLERAARAAGAPVAAHYLARDEEGPVIVHWGGCATCRRVNAGAAGTSACRADRIEAGMTALRQWRGIPFVCHMGFTCIAAPAFPDQNFVLTVGPYVAVDADERLEARVRRRLDALGLGSDNVDAPNLADIHRAPEGAVHAVVEWTREELERLWRLEVEAKPRESAPEPVVPPLPDAPVGRGRVQEFHPVPYQATEVALALAGGQMAFVRDTLEVLLGEAHRGKRPKPAVRRARILAAVTAALEAAENAMLDTTGAWEQLAAFLDDIEGQDRDNELLDAAVRVLRRVRSRKTAKEACAASDNRLAYKELNALVIKKLPKSVKLSEVAKQLGLKAPTISKRLKRQFGMSYSEYVGRLRIDRAKSLLRRTRMRAAEVAHSVGIRDQSHFSKLFKKFEGMTPSEYRDQFGKRP